VDRRRAGPSIQPGNLVVQQHVLDLGGALRQVSGSLLGALAAVDGLVVGGHGVHRQPARRRCVRVMAVGWGHPPGLHDVDGQVPYPRRADAAPETGRCRTRAASTAQRNAARDSGVWSYPTKIDVTACMATHLPPPTGTMCHCPWTWDGPRTDTGEQSANVRPALAKGSARGGDSGRGSAYCAGTPSQASIPPIRKVAPHGPRIH
jgi:hypothetical protein